MPTAASCGMGHDKTSIAAYAIQETATTIGNICIFLTSQQALRAQMIH